MLIFTVPKILNLKKKKSNIIYDTVYTGLGS
jgi:hypothetical protein